jgi:hypothetical protein
MEDVTLFGIDLEKTRSACMGKVVQASTACVDSHLWDGERFR